MSIVKILTSNTISEFKVLVVMSKMILFHFFQILREFGMMQSNAPHQCRVLT